MKKTTNIRTSCAPEKPCDACADKSAANEAAFLLAAGGFIKTKSTPSRAAVAVKSTPPDGYAAIVPRAAAIINDQHGVPDSYAAGLAALARRNAETDATATPRTAAIVVYDAEGVPDSYQTALARRKERKD